MSRVLYISGKIYLFANRRFIIGRRRLQVCSGFGCFHKGTIWRYVLHMCGRLSTNASEISLKGTRLVLFKGESNNRQRNNEYYIYIYILQS